MKHIIGCREDHSEWHMNPSCREAEALTRERDGAMTLERTVITSLSCVQFMSLMQTLAPKIYVQRVQRNVFFWWVDCSEIPPHEGLIQPAKVNSVHGKLSLQLPLSVFFPTNTHTWTWTNTQSDVCEVWKKGNPSDICFSHYHNNWHSTAQSKSVADWGRIIRERRKKFQS